MTPIFHLTAKDGPLPQRFQKNLDCIKALYPDYEIRVHSDADIDAFVKSHFPDYYHNTFIKMPKHIMRVDTVRYMWMYVYGGVYCDFDIKFLKHIDFPESPAFIRRDWTHPIDKTITTSVHNCIFASTPGHTVWLDILQGIEKNAAAIPRGPFAWLKKKPQVFDVTGPNAISRIITQEGLLERYSDVVVLPGDLLYQECFSQSPRETAGVVHETFGSWR